MDYTNTPPPPPPAYRQLPPPPGPRKGLHPLAWAGIGCGGIVLIGIVIAAIAFFTVGKSVMLKMAEHPGKEAAARALAGYPDMEKVSEDTGKGQITLKPKAGGAEVASTYEEVVLGTKPVPAAGDLAKVPAWLPPYPGAADVVVMAQEDGPASTKGIIAFTTTDSDEKAVDFYDKAMDALSSSSSSSSSRSFANFNGQVSRRVTVRVEKKSITVDAFKVGTKPLTVQVSYEEMK